MPCSFFFGSVSETTYSCCHEFPPSQSILSTSLRGRQSKIHRSQVGLHGSEPGLPWTTNPASPVVRWTRYAGLGSSVVILTGVGTVKMSKVYLYGNQLANDKEDVGDCTSTSKPVPKHHSQKQLLAPTLSDNQSTRLAIPPHWVLSRPSRPSTNLASSVSTSLSSFHPSTSNVLTSPPRIFFTVEEMKSETHWRARYL